MIVVTGGAGFIGSNLVRGLNRLGRQDILVVDNLTNGIKFRNIVDCNILDIVDKEDFLTQVNDNLLGPIEVIFHQGACSVTTEWNGRYMMKNNYEYSKHLFQYAYNKKIPFIYASSAAVYGSGVNFSEHPDHEMPLNIYGYSKLIFDQYVRRHMAKAKNQIVGLRYFNIYGPGESHKGSMASVAYHFNRQILEDNKIKLFSGSGGYEDGEQRRDFTYVTDVVDIILWFWEHKQLSGIYNVGTGHSQSFNEVANAVINWHHRGEIHYIPMPDHLKNSYQSFTQADITQLRHLGYEGKFKRVEEAMLEYLDLLNTGD